MLVANSSLAGLCWLTADDVLTVIVCDVACEPTENLAEPTEIIACWFSQTQSWRGLRGSEPTEPTEPTPFCIYIRVTQNHGMSVLAEWLLRGSQKLSFKIAPVVMMRIVGGDYL